jgi:hypothetical protein
MTAYGGAAGNGSNDGAAGNVSVNTGVNIPIRTQSLTGPVSSGVLTFNQTNSAGGNAGYYGNEADIYTGAGGAGGTAIASFTAAQIGASKSYTLGNRGNGGNNNPGNGGGAGNIGAILITEFFS